MKLSMRFSADFFFFFDIIMEIFLSDRNYNNVLVSFAKSDKQVFLEPIA